MILDDIVPPINMGRTNDRGVGAIGIGHHRDMHPPMICPVSASNPNRNGTIVISPKRKKPAEQFARQKDGLQPTQTPVFRFTTNYA